MRGAVSYQAIVTGQVQGLGFRPFVYRLAQQFGLAGTVANTRRGVVIIVQGRRARQFLDRLRDHPPALSRITSFKVTVTRSRAHRAFAIIGSRAEAARASVDVLPDLALCNDCRADMLERPNRRYEYPFTNCTQCGPRYTIIESLPYDRPATTMRGFRMCACCRREYENPSNRRFHAQPNACPACGPKLTLLDRSGKVVHADPLAATAAAIARGGVVAVKSLGGFQLACDATNPRAVVRLRRLKDRPSKPLALMCDRLADIRMFARVSQADAKLLSSPAAPIVLLPKLSRPGLALADSVAQRNSRLGVMLAYTPLHLVLFRRIRRLSNRAPVLVMTSANRRDDPITISEDELASRFGRAFDLVLTHNRPIANRCDDSVVLSSTPAIIMVRRARGFAPRPVRLARVFHVKHPVLAVGADLKTAFALAQGERVFLSPHIGSLDSPEAEAFFLDTLGRYTSWTGIKPARVACDLHPDYRSTRLAERIAHRLGIPLIRIQHHFAHIASVLAEHGLAGPVLGIAADGAGYGTDGNIWGCELLSVERDLSWTRLGHLGYLRLKNPGVDPADPDQVGREYLSQAKGARPAVSGILTSSLGRLFDAVAAISGVCRTATFDGEAPMALENAVDPRERGSYFVDGDIDLALSPAVFRPEPLLLAVSRETRRGVDPAVVAARFHHAVADGLARFAHELARQRGLRSLCLSGGVWQNSTLRSRAAARLCRLGYSVFTNADAPMNDGGIALGQALVAGCLRID